MPVGVHAVEAEMPLLISAMSSLIAPRQAAIIYDRRAVLIPEQGFSDPVDLPPDAARPIR
jgi:hypothetical protein